MLYKLGQNCHLFGVHECKNNIMHNVMLPGPAVGNPKSNVYVKIEQKLTAKWDECYCSAVGACVPEASLTASVAKLFVRWLMYTL